MPSPEHGSFCRLLIGGVPDQGANRLTDSQIRDEPGDMDQALIGLQSSVIAS